MDVTRVLSNLVSCVTKRRSSWACIGNPNPEQETIKGTHAQETSAVRQSNLVQKPRQLAEAERGE